MSKNYVCNGAEIECALCSNPKGNLMVTSNQIKVQGKICATDADNQKPNLIFKGNCSKSPNSALPCISVITLGSWENTADTLIQGNKALLENSIIMCNYGGVPIKITDDLQINIPSQLLPVVAPVAAPSEEPKIVKLEWKSNKETEKDG